MILPLRQKSILKGRQEVKPHWVRAHTHSVSSQLPSSSSKRVWGVLHYAGAWRVEIRQWAAPAVLLPLAMNIEQWSSQTRLHAEKQREHTLPHSLLERWETTGVFLLEVEGGREGGKGGGRRWCKIFLEMSTHQSSVGGILLSSFWQYITWVMRYCLLLIKLLEYSYMPNYAMLAPVDRKHHAVYLRKEESGDNWAIVRQSII